MNRANLLGGEFWDYPEGFNESIIGDLEPLLQLIFEVWTPEVSAYIERYNQWLKEASRARGDQLNQDSLGHVHGTLGSVAYDIRGQRFNRDSHIPSMWHVQDPLNIASQMSGASKDQLNALIERTDGGEFMKLKLDRPIVRENYDFVVGA